MSGAARLGDICTGHGCYPSRPNDQASPNCFVNNLGHHRQSDHWTTHCCPPIPACHDSFLQSGSSVTFVNSLEAGRIGDPVACGSYVLTGSPDTDVGPTPVSGPGSIGWSPDAVYMKWFRSGASRSGDRLLEISDTPFS